MVLINIEVYLYLYMSEVYYVARTKRFHADADELSMSKSLRC